MNMVMEKVRGFKGVYHVLGGALSPLDNVTVSDLTIRELVDRVAEGDYLGEMGNTGYSFGPHLHLEVIKNGVKVNPNKYLKP